jgi:hypothetical protein
MHNVLEHLAFNHPFSQVIENIRRQSCEGLALPFLANWLLGKAQACLNRFCLLGIIWKAMFQIFLDVY